MLSPVEACEQRLCYMHYRQCSGVAVPAHTSTGLSITSILSAFAFLNYLIYI
jgi:hypothetical protein